jgi:DNA-directed RNA polymerase subunit E"
MPEKACKSCRRLVKGNVCPICKTSDLTTNWRGIIVILDTDSEIAKAANITSPGKYAVRVR